MKRYKKLGILLTVLVVICIATFALSQYERAQEEIRSSDEVILEIPRDSVTALSWEYTEEGSLAFHKGESSWVYDGDDAFPVSEDKVMEILSHFEALQASFIIENVEDYNQYGLDDPECTLHISTEDTTYDIKLGDFSKMDEQRYVDIGDGNVYLLSEDPMDYVDPALSAMIEDDDTPAFENVVDIRFTGTENYTIDRTEDSGYSYSDQDVYFVQENGAYLPLDTSSVTTYLNTITALDLLTYVTYNATDEELAAYGLDSPELSITVNYTYTDENAEDGQPIAGSCVIHIGQNQEELQAAQESEDDSVTEDSVTKYVRIGDSPIVYELDSVDYAILSDAAYNDLRHKEVFWGDFEDVYQVDVTLEGTTHTLVSERNDEEERLWYYQEVTEEADALDLTAFQDALESLTADTFTDEAPTEKEEIRLTLYLENENFPQVEIVLYRYDGTSCLAAVDGESVSLVSRSTVMDLVEAVQAIVLD